MPFFRCVIVSPTPNGCWPAAHANNTRSIISANARCTFLPMCAGAIYWAGIGGVVYGLSEKRLKAITGNHPDNPTLDLSCRTVFAAGHILFG